MSNVLDLTPEQINQLRIRERLKGLATRDVLLRWYASADPFDLTEQEERIRQRWDYAKAQFLARKTWTEVRDELVNEFGIGPATAGRDIRDALNCFGEIDRVPVEAHRQRAIQMALEAFNVAKEEKDGKAMAAATKAYIEASGIDKDDSQRIDIERMMRERVYVEAIDPMVRNLLLNLIEQAGGSLDLSKVFEQIYQSKNAEFVDYEETPDDAGTDTGGD